MYIFVSKVVVSIFEFINIDSSPTLLTPIASPSAHRQVLPVETLTCQIHGESNVTGNAVNIEDTEMRDSNQNSGDIEIVINTHIYFLSNVARLIMI